MKKVFLLLVIAVCCSNLFAQIAQTFVPEVGKTYYIKPESHNKAAWRQFLSLDDTDNNKLRFKLHTTSEAIADANAKWEIQYVDGKGYVLKNKGSEKYVTNVIDASSATLDETKCYFDFSSKGDLYIGSAWQTPTYAILIAGTGDGFDISINDTYSTVNKWSYGGGQDNRRFLIVPEDKLSCFDFPYGEGGTYYIKSLRSDFKNGYIAENANAQLAVISAENAATDPKAQWEVAFVSGSGYTIKNKSTGHYFTGANLANNTTNGIDLSSSSPSYFNLPLYTKGGNYRSYEQGKYADGVYSKTTFGACFIVPAGATVAMDAFKKAEGDFGVWTWLSNSDNGAFIFQTPSEAKLSSGIINNAFTPIADTKYYIKSIWPITPDQGRTKENMVDIYVSDNGGLKLETVTESNIKTSEMAQWYITLDQTDGGYYFQNKGTNNYIKVASNGEVSMAAKDDVNSFLFNIALYGNSTNPVYTYTNSTTEKSFTTVGYHLINKSYNKELDLNRSLFTIGTWSPEDNLWKCWMILTEAELTKLLNVKNGITTSSSIASALQTSVYSSDNVIYVNSTESIQEISVYNMQGQLLYAGTSTTIEGISGVCIVKISTKNGINNHKLLVK